MTRLLIAIFVLGTATALSAQSPMPELLYNKSLPDGRSLCFISRETRAELPENSTERAVMLSLEIRDTDQKTAIVLWQQVQLSDFIAPVRVLDGTATDNMFVVAYAVHGNTILRCGPLAVKQRPENPVKMVLPTSNPFVSGPYSNAVVILNYEATAARCTILSSNLIRMEVQPESGGAQHFLCFSSVEDKKILAGWWQPTNQPAVSK